MTYRAPTVINGIKVSLDIAMVIGILIAAALAIWIALSPFVMLAAHKDAWIVAMVSMDDINLRTAEQSSEPGPARIVTIDSRHRPHFGELPTAENITAILSSRTSDWSTQFCIWGFWLLAMLAGIWELQLMRSMVRTALAGQPFADANARRLNLIGLLTLAYVVVAPVGVYLTSRLALASVAGTEAHLKPWFEVEPVSLINGLVLLGLATVFRHGRRLEEEQSLTV